MIKWFHLGARLFRAISQTWITYQDSPIVGGDNSVQVARPGDRIPYALFETGETAGKSVFSVLYGIDHHLLIFTEANEEKINSRVDAILQKYRICVHLQVIGPEQRNIRNALGVVHPTAFLVRPDGHIAWRGTPENLKDLESYLDQWYVRA
jgi:hypothetical protein